MLFLLVISACRDFSRVICEGAILYEPDKPAIDTTCINDPTTTPMDPVVEWEWPGTTSPNEVASTPLVSQLNDDDGNGKIDDDDDPDVIFFAYEYDQTAPNMTSPSLVTVRGKDGLTQLTNQSPYEWVAWGVPAVGDLTGDGTPEICGPTAVADAVCVDPAGNVVVVAKGPGVAARVGAITLADLDHDGKVEIIVGERIYSSSGALIAEATPQNAFALYRWRLGAVAAQLDADPEWEVVNGSRAYNLDGTLSWDDTVASGVGISAIADTDGDAMPEIVTAAYGKVSLTQHDGTHTWTYAMPAAWDTVSNELGPPLIADLDGNGTLEIGVSSPSFYTVLDAQGNVVWQVPAKDHLHPSYGTGAVAYDFEGDGVYEIVHADADRIRVLDGATGIDRWTQLTTGFDPTRHASATIMEYPTVADLDKDGSAEILLGSSWWKGLPTGDWQGLRAIGSQSSSWRPARQVWNQYSYDVQNVNDDGSIPINPTPNWLAGNTFRAVEDTPEGGYYAVPNLYAQSLYSCDVECAEGDPWTVYFSIANDGSAPAMHFDVQLQDGNGAMIFGETVLLLPAGETRLFGPWMLKATHWQFGPVRIVVDATHAVEECDEADNAYTIDEFCVY